MRFLADECRDLAAVRALRAHGHDVLAVREFKRCSVDNDVMDVALAENRILVPGDKAFGWLVFVGRMDSTLKSFILRSCYCGGGIRMIRMQINLDEQEHAFMRAEARSLGIPMTEFVRRAIRAADELRGFRGDRQSSIKPVCR